MEKIDNIFLSLKYFGITSVFQSVFHKLLKKSGFMKLKSPIHKWQDINFNQLVINKTLSDDLKLQLKKITPFYFQQVGDSKTVFDNLKIDKEKIIKEADEILNNNYILFSVKKYHSNNINWHQNPFNQTIWPQNIHWSELSYFSKQHGDIKSVWELARFGFTYSLVRAYVLTGDAKYAEKFWQLFESWFDQIPPNDGVHWVSGQECAIRTFAWYFALFAFIDDKSSSGIRIEKMLKAICLQGERIENFICHAIRQKTNHSISEAAGLYTIATLSPFFKNSKRWLKKSKKILIREVLRQVYEDGSYVQQSMNYHRLMLQVVSWISTIARINNDKFPGKYSDRLDKAVNFLFQMQDQKTGSVPNYGPNDGALIFPLNTCSYLDYRPAIQACYYALHKKIIYPNGDHLEDLIWFFGPEAIESEIIEIERKSLGFDIGGYYTFRADNSWAMIRCHSYIDRIAQVDIMHFDFWTGGQNLLRDCGSYRYFVPDEPQMQTYFESIFAHNTIIVDNQSPLRKVSRFVLLPWPKAKVNQFQIQNKRIYFNGENLAYQRKPWNVLHIRKIIEDSENWQIIDEVDSDIEHEFQLRWQLHPDADIIETNDRQVHISLPDGWSMLINCDNSVKINVLQCNVNGGWQSLYYSEKIPLKTLVLKSEIKKSAVFNTKIYKG